MNALSQAKNGCFMVEKGAPCLILLGKNGDLCQMLGAFKAIHDRTGADPIVMVSTEFAGIFDGVSYVQPFPIHGHWYTQICFARDLAKSHFGGALVIPWWHETDRADEITREQGEGAGVLQSHGLNFGCDMSRNPNYGTSMMWRCGFSRQEMMNLFPVFDRRNQKREQSLVDMVLPKNSAKPIVLYTFSGQSSPFAYVPEVMRTVLNHTSKFKFIDIGNIMAHRFYDMLALFERAVGLITIDTLALHLAPATDIKYFAFLVDGWSQSTPKRNCFRAIPYSQTLTRLHELDEYLSSL